MNKLYFYLSNDLCTLNENTGMWSIELPRDFTLSRSPQKSISVLNFKYCYKHDCVNHHTTTIPIDETSFHSPTLSDGNFNQDHYITNANYQFNTVYKSYRIRSQPQFFEFFFKNVHGEVVKKFNYSKVESGEECPTIEFFRVEMELIY